MANPSDIFNVSRISFEGNFDEQVTEILFLIRLSRHEVVGLQELINDLEYALRNMWPDCKAYPFGSIITGLGIKTSDVDCYVKLPENFTPRKSPVIIAKNILRSYPSRFSELFSIPSANVPILKFYHIPTNCHCDVNFKSPAGVRNSRLISYFMNVDPRILHTTILVKYWSKIYKFTGTNLMGNYVLTTLCIFYFQQKGMLPSVAKLQENIEMYIVDCWNTAFDSNIKCKINNNENLYELLGGFFKFYATFDFAQLIVSTYLGYPIQKKLFEKLETVPAEYDLYKYNVTNRYCKGLRTNTIVCVQDSFDHSRNCSVAIFPKLMERIIGHFKFAAAMYEKTSSREFLRALLCKDPVIPDKEPSIQYLSPKRKIVKNKNQQIKKKVKKDFNHWLIENNVFYKRKK